MPAPAAFAAPTRRRRPLRALALVLPLAAAAPAVAQSALDPDEIRARVQAALQGYVEQSEGMLQPQGEPSAVRDGDAVVLTLPEMLVAGPEGELRVPPTSVRLHQQDADRIAFSTALPMPLQGSEPGAAAPAFTVNVAGQQIEGVYRPSLLIFERFDLRFDDLRTTTPEGEAVIGSLRVEARLDETEPGFWSGAAGLTLGDVRFHDPQRQPQVAIALIDFKWTLDHYRQAEFSELQRKIYGDNPFASMSADPTTQIEPMLEMLERLPELLAGASGEMAFSLGGLEVATPAAPPFSLGRAGFSIAMAPQEAEHYGLRLGLDAEGPQVADGMLPVPAHLLPRRAELAAELKRLPVLALWQALSEPLTAGLGDELKRNGELSPESEQQLDEHMQLFPLIAMELLGQAGSFGEIRQVELAVGPATLTARGVAPLLPGQPEPPLRIEAAIAGLDDLAAEVQALEPAQQEQLMPFVVMLRGLGKTAAVDGKVVHTYLIEQTPEGLVTVNGVSLDEIGPK